MKKYGEQQVFEEDIKQLWTWGKVLLIYLVQESEEKIQDYKNSKEQMEFQQFLEQINSQIQGTNFHLLYHEELFKNTSIQRLLAKIRNIDRKEYQEIVRQLSDVILLLQHKKNYLEQKDVNFSWFERTMLVHKYGNQQLSEEFFSKLQKWSETLFTYQDVHTPILKSIKDKTETQYVEQQIETSKEENKLQYIQQQIEISKQKTELQQLISQINYQIQEVGIQLEYQEKQLKDTSIQSLLNKIRAVEKQEYQEIVQQLSDMILLLQYTKQGFNNQNILRKKYKVEQLSEKSIQEFREYGKALLVHPTQKVNKNQIEIFSESQQFENKNNLDENNLQENLKAEFSKQPDKKITKQTELQYIQQQIELSKDRVELQKLIYQINHNIQKTNIQIAYWEEQLKNVSIKNLLTRLRKADETEYKKIVYQLSDMILLLRQEEHLDYVQEKEILEHIILARKYGKQNLSKESIRELKRLGEILLPYLIQSTKDKNLERIFNNQQLDKNYYVGENFPLEFVPKQVSKEQETLQKLIYQINHQIKKDDIQLEYQEAYLKNSSLQSLVTKISEIDKQEYQKMVHQLSDVILLLQSKRQKSEIILKEDAMQNFSNEKLFYIRQADSKKIDGAYSKLIHDIQIYEEHRRKKKKNNIISLEENTKLRQQLLQQIKQQQAINQKETIQEPAIMQQQETLQTVQLQEIVPIMQQQEILQTVQQQEIVPIIQQQEILQTVQQQEIVPIIQQQEILQKKTIQEQIIMQQEMEHWQQIIEKYSPLQHVNIDKTAKDDLQKKESYIQEETIKIETLHQQLDVRLKDLENKLERVEEHTYTKENIRDITEKVKRQLQEELHLERLRRGLV